MKCNVDKNYIEELIHDISLGKKDSLECLYNITKSSIFGFAFSILKNIHDAEDVMQDTYININKYAGIYNSRNKPLAWILTITKNLSLEKLKKNKKSSLEEFDEVVSSSIKDDHYNTIFVKNILDSLTEEERKIIIISSIKGFKYREVASMLNLKLSTVLSKYHRAVKKMRSIYKEV